MTSEDESRVGVKNEGTQREESSNKEVSEVREVKRVKVEGKRRSKKGGGSSSNSSGSTANITRTTAVKMVAKNQEIPKRLLTKLKKHESALQEISSSIKILSSKRFRKKIDSIDMLLKEVKVLDRRLRKAEKIISRLR